jgi:hypothetical protein
MIIRVSTHFSWFDNQLDSEFVTEWSSQDMLKNNGIILFCELVTWVLITLGTTHRLGVMFYKKVKNNITALLLFTSLRITIFFRNVNIRGSDLSTELKITSKFYLLRNKYLRHFVFVYIFAIAILDKQCFYQFIITVLQ